MTQFQREIESQPEILAKLVEDVAIIEAASRLRGQTVPFIATLARGSSDNAVSFFAYLAGQLLGIPVASVPPSLLTLYQSSLKLSGALAIAVSQSGESSDVVAALKNAKKSGATTLAISNEANSTLLQVADYGLEQQAGPEQAVAASKTFISQMMVLTALVAHWSQDRTLLEALKRVPELAAQLIGEQAPIERAALRLTYARSAYILGRGLSYGPALEMALKLKETSYLHAQAYSSAEFQHGPIAAVDPADPIILLASNDPTRTSNREVAERLNALGAGLTVVSGDKALLEQASAKIILPSGLHPVGEAFLQVIVGQLLALHLTLSKGLDPDAPRYLSKVTQTM